MRKHIQTYSKVYNARSLSKFYGDYIMEHNCFNREPLVFHHIVLLHGIEPKVWHLALLK